MSASNKPPKALDPLADSLLEQLDKEYPDTIAALAGLSDKERDAYIAKRELIAHIKLIFEKG